MRLPVPPARPLLATLALVGAAWVCSDAAAEPKTEVDVVVDLTPAGRAVSPPSPGHPIYYVPVLGGYQQLGAQLAGEPPPPQPVTVAHEVAKALAGQGYLVMGPNRPPPSLVLAVHWGRLNPQIETDPLTGQRIVFNQTQMLSLTGGTALNHLDLGFEREAAMQGAERDRYFVAVTAYELEAYQKRHAKVMLWQAKMSVPASGLTLAEVMPVLAKAGGPMFGRETLRPKMLILPLSPGGRVEIGVPTVKDYQDVPLRSAPAATATPAGAGAGK
jgi:hypothetical protein